MSWSALVFYALGFEKFAFVCSIALAYMTFTAYWTISRQTNTRSVKSQTGQLAK